MKLTIAQALGTVLNIQIAPTQNHQLATIEQWFVIRDPSGDKKLDVGLGLAEGEGAITLDQAVWKAAQLTSFSNEAKFAIFPISSNREDYYMAIERELLRQESTEEFAGRFMWQMLPAGDPRQLIEAIMLQIRECAVAITHPITFQQAMLRVACLVISCMQWTSDWLGRLRMQQAIVSANRPEPPKVVDFVPPADQGPGNDLQGTVTAEPAVTPAEVPPLFGVAGLKVVDSPPSEPVSEKKEDTLAHQKYGSVRIPKEKKRKGKRHQKKKG